MGIYLNTTGADHVRTYVYNENQVYSTNLVGLQVSDYILLSRIFWLHAQAHLLWQYLEIEKSGTTFVNQIVTVLHPFASVTRFC